MSDDIWLNDFHRQHTETLRDHLSRQPKASLQDAMKQYDRIKSQSSSRRLSAELGLPEDVRVKRCLELLREFFPADKDALKWLHTPHPDLAGQKALAILRTNPDALLTLLSNARNGVPL